MKQNNVKKIDDNVMSTNYDVTVIFLIYVQTWSYPEATFRTHSLLNLHFH